MRRRPIPMGLHVADTFGDLLIEKRCSQLNVTHDDLQYNFLISNGRIQSETIRLLAQP